MTDAEEWMGADPAVAQAVHGSARRSPVRPVMYRRRWRPERTLSALLTLALCLAGWTLMTWVSLRILAWLGWRP